ncbi:MAG: hypothetical protein ACOYM3_16430 [Terrimicrobiaceae bacterium]
MEPRKYSTGTKGRLKMHSDKCKEFIQANSPNFSLAKEFIESLDPDREEAIWQRFQSPEDILPELQAWLGGGDEMPASAKPSAPLPAIHRRIDIKPASQLPRRTDLQKQADVAMKKARTWLASAEGMAQLDSLPPAEAAEIALRKFYRELTGEEPPGTSL